MRVTIADCRAAGLCVLGVKKWFDANKLDFRDFLQHGMMASELLAVDPVLPNRAIPAARKRVHG